MGTTKNGNNSIVNKLDKSKPYSMTESLELAYKLNDKENGDEARFIEIHNLIIKHCEIK